MFTECIKAQNYEARIANQTLVFIQIKLELQLLHAWQGTCECGPAWSVIRDLREPLADLGFSVTQKSSQQNIGGVDKGQADVLHHLKEQTQHYLQVQLHSL